MTYKAMLMAAAAAAPVTAAPAGAQVADDPRAEIVITGIPLAGSTDETATSATVIAGDDLVHRRQATLGESLASEPGIASDTFGGGASRPVIRGQTAPRVRILSDGSEIHDASAVSPDHAVVTEPLLLRRVEILRGPSALLYGGGAIGGAVNLVDDKIPTELPEAGFDALGELRLGTADDERTAVGAVTAGIGSFAFRAEGVYRRSDDYRVPDFETRRVPGSFNDTSHIAVGGSWVGSDGYFGVAYTRQRSEYGLPGHSHEYEDCHPHGSSLHCSGHDEEEGDDHDHDHDHEHEEEEHLPPFVKLRSDRFDIRGEYRAPLPWIDRVRFRAGITDYEHDEIERHAHHEDHEEEHGEDHEAEIEEEIATTFRNKAWDARLEIEHAAIGPLRGVIGLQTSKSEFSALGEEAFLPESDTRNTGIFLLEKLPLGAVTLEFAGRQEWQRIETTLDRKVEHAPTSLSASALWEFSPGFSAAIALSRSQRAPTAQELFARGVHLATNTYEIGDATLGVETSTAIDLTLRKTTGATRFTIGLFRNSIDDFIFADTLDRFEDFRLIRYAQADARFIGIDGEISHRFGPAVEVGLFGDYVRAKLRDGGGNLPRIPAGRLGARTELGSGPLHADIEYYHVFEQSRIAAFETRTPGHDMVNATLAYRLPTLFAAEGEFFVRGTNLLNELAFNHASFVRNAAPLRGRNFVVGLRLAL